MQGSSALFGVASISISAHNISLASQDLEIPREAMGDFFWEKAGLSAGEGDLSDVIRAAKPAAAQSEPSMWHLPAGPPAPTEQGASSSSGFGDPFAGTEDAPYDEMPDKDLFEEIKGAPYDIIRVSPVIASDDVAKNIGVASGPTIAPPVRAPGTKRSMHRKGQAKKVVCIPAPVAASSAPTASGRPTNGSEVVPSDLWAWRKYGQKPIKGSPYPRGYYRCSSSKGCSARKQVERSRTDPNMLVITYTSEHNHPWPTHRNTLAGSTRGGPLSKSLCLNPSIYNPIQSLPPQASARDELNKMTSMLKMPNDVLFKQEVMEAGPTAGLFCGLTELEADPISLILSNKGSTHGEEIGDKVIDPFSLFK